MRVCVCVSKSYKVESSHTRVCIANWKQCWMKRIGYVYSIRRIYTWMRIVKRCAMVERAWACYNGTKKNRRGEMNVIQKKNVSSGNGDWNRKRRRFSSSGLHNTHSDCSSSCGCYFNNVISVPVSLLWKKNSDFVWREEKKKSEFLLLLWPLPLPPLPLSSSSPSPTQIRQCVVLLLLLYMWLVFL